MLNLGFEQGWDDVFIGGTDSTLGREAQQPKGWMISALPVGSTLKSAGVFPDDDPPIYEVVKTIPEVKHVNALQLPVDQRLGGPDALVLDGEWTFKVFSAYNPYSFTARTRLLPEDTGAQPGDTLRITVNVTTHYHPYPGGDGSLGACRWRASASGEGDSGGTWHTYQIDVEDRAWFTYTFDVKTDADGVAELSIDLESAAISGITYFVDACAAVVIPDNPEPPQPGECRGTPREPYERTYVLLPPLSKLTQAEYQDLMGRLAPSIYLNGWTVGFSADDAGIGDLDVRKVIVILAHEDDWDRDKLSGFFEAYYPGVQVLYKEMYQIMRFPVGVDAYAPAYWYVAQGFSTGATGHPGIDINLDLAPWGDVERGMPVTAVAAGEVTYITSSWSGVGMAVVRHTVEQVSYWCRYGHLEVDRLSVGQRVEPGEILGGIANYDGGDHLHFEVHTAPFTREYRTGNELNPVPWMKDVLGLDPVLVDAFVRKGDSPTEPPEPPEPPGPEPSYTLRSGNVLGLHSGFQKKYWDTYWTGSGANAQKVFTLGFGMEARRIVPDPAAVIDWRKHSDEVVGPYDNPVKLLDRYSAEIATHCQNTGQTEAEVLEAITCIESLNETIGTFAPDAIKAAVAFDVGFAEALHQRYGDALKPCLLNVAIGNPHESEVELLLPAARAAALYEGFVGYHAYWTADRDRDYLTEYWNIHAGRWMKWDEVFRANGVYPRYLLSEGGIVYAPGGLNFNSGRGWKSCGSFEKYLVQQDTFVRLVNEWNAIHGNRAAALTVFCHGNNWENFELEDNVLLMLERSEAWR